jgi:hypothetical protein
METTIITILKLLGLSTPVATTVATMGLTPVIVIVMIILSKFVIVPFLTKTYEKYVLFGDAILKKLDILIESNNKILNSQDKIDNMIEDVMSDSIGYTDKRLALKIFASNTHKQLLLCHAFYNVRQRQNHIKTERDAIIGRYNRKSTEMSGKAVDMLSEFTYNGKSLSIYWSNMGSESFFRHLFNDFFMLQEEVSEGKVVKDSDITDTLDRILATLMNSFKVWLDTSEVYIDQKLGITLWEEDILE